MLSDWNLSEIVRQIFQPSWSPLTVGSFNAGAVLPNWSFNRTLCGGPSLGSKSLAQTRPTAKCRLTRTLGVIDLTTTSTCAESAGIPSARLTSSRRSPKFRFRTSGSHRNASSAQSRSSTIPAAKARAFLFSTCRFLLLREDA